MQMLAWECYFKRSHKASGDKRRAAAQNKTWQTDCTCGMTGGRFLFSSEWQKSTVDQKSKDLPSLRKQFAFTGGDANSH